jgi:hypothetical protein
MRGFLVNHRTAGIVLSELNVPQKKSKFRGRHDPDNLRGVEKVKQAIELIKQILNEESDPEYKRLLAQAGLNLNRLILR